MRYLKSAVACVGSAVALLAAGVLADPSGVSAAPPVQGQYGTIKGRLVWGGAAVPTLPPLVKAGDQNVKDAAVCAATDLPDRRLAIDPSTKGVRYGFAYLVRPKGANAAAVKELVSKAPKAEIDQKNCEFLPRCLALHKDQVVVFKSSDPVGHNVRYTGFTNPAKNVALPPNGSTEAKLVPEARPLPLNCDIHPWMKGWMMVFDHPFFAVTSEDGSFEITGVPAGAQNLVVWQEETGYVTSGAAKGQAVTVKAGETTNVGEIKLDPAKVKKK
jgi:hypothetical protein